MPVASVVSVGGCVGLSVTMYDDGLLHSPRAYYTAEPTATARRGWRRLSDTLDIVAVVSIGGAKMAWPAATERIARMVSSFSAPLMR